MAKSGKSSCKPNILVIFGDDIGMWNVGAYTHGMMGRTPNIDRIASEGILFTDHYGQASCTAGRAAHAAELILSPLSNAQRNARKHTGGNHEHGTQHSSPPRTFATRGRGQIRGRLKVHGRDDSQVVRSRDGGIQHASNREQTEPIGHARRRVARRHFDCAAEDGKLAPEPSQRRNAGEREHEHRHRRRERRLGARQAAEIVDVLDRTAVRRIRRMQPNVPTVMVT